MRTNEKHLVYFEKRVRHWQKELGLVDWSIHVERKKLEDKFAQTEWGDESGVGTIFLSTDWGLCKVNNPQLDRTALHECCHLLMSSLTNEARARYASEYDIDRAEHHIIRVIENLVTGLNR